MERQKGSQFLVIAILSIAILTMSIGFAVMAQQLDITGNANVVGSTWKVEFDNTAANVVVTTGSVTDNKPTVTATTATFDIELAEFGDFYEFTIPVVNKGTYDAILKSIVMSTLEGNRPDYLTYTVTYGSTTYNASASNLAIDLAKNGGTENVKVRVQYNEPAPGKEGSLPAETEQVPFSVTLNYEQKVATP